MASTIGIRGLLRTEQGDVVGTVDVSNHSGLYSGSIDLSMTPAQIIELFRGYEELVNGQMLSLVDAVDAQIEAMAVSFNTSDQGPLRVRDLQIYPSEGAVSFRLLDQTQ